MDSMVSKDASLDFLDFFDGHRASAGSHFGGIGVLVLHTVSHLATFENSCAHIKFHLRHKVAPMTQQNAHMTAGGASMAIKCHSEISQLLAGISELLTWFQEVQPWIPWYQKMRH